MDQARSEYPAGGERWYAESSESAAAQTPRGAARPPKRRRPEFASSSERSEAPAAASASSPSAVRVLPPADGRQSSFAMLMGLVESYQCAVDGYKIFEMNPFRTMTGTESLGELFKHYGESRISFLLSAIQYYQELLEQHLMSSQSPSPPPRRTESLLTLREEIQAIRDDLHKSHRRVEALEASRRGPEMSI